MLVQDHNLEVAENVVWLLLCLCPPAAKTVVEAAKNIFKAAFGEHSQPGATCTVLPWHTHSVLAEYVYVRAAHD